MDLIVIGVLIVVIGAAIYVSTRRRGSHNPIVLPDEKPEKPYPGDRL